MPEICRFNGITIHVYTNEHLPEHFHAKYGEYEAQISTETLTCLNGNLPTRQRRLVAKWAKLRRTELLNACQQARRGELPGKVAPP